MKKFITSVVIPVALGSAVTAFFVWVVLLASNFHGF